jgi:putative FmdB family regulatory protein
MPMYQYACEACGQPFEKKLAMAQAGETQECPACGSLQTRKRLGAVALGRGATPTRTPSAPPRTSPFS